ncbi:MAG: hypothetical protein AAF518_02765 [Spirochaetota bacterium]
MIQTLLIVLGCLLAAFCLLTVSILIFLNRLLTADFLVKNIELQFNCRASIETVKISLLHIFFNIILENLQITYRDAEADQAIPLQDRQSITQNVLQVKRVELKLSLFALFKKGIKVQKFMFYEPLLNLFINKDGSNNISEFFYRPEIVAGKANPKYIRPIVAKAMQENAASTKKTKPFSIRNMPVSARLEKIGIKDAHVNLKVRKTGQLLQLKGLQAVVDSIHVHPNKLHLYNALKLFYSFDLVIIGKDKKENARFFLDCQEDLRPFLQDTGTIDPSLVYRVNVRRTSYIRSMIIVNLLSGVISVLKTLGIRLESTTREQLLRNTILELTFYQGRLTLQKKANLLSTSLDLEFDENSWLQITNNEHLFFGSFILYKKESRKSINNIDTFVHSALREAYSEMTREKVFDSIMKNDRIQIPFKSYGDIRSPKVDLDIKIPSIGGLFKGIVRGGSAGAGKLLDKGMDRLKDWQP